MSMKPPMNETAKPIGNTTTDVSTPGQYANVENTTNKSQPTPSSSVENVTTGINK